eukprot:CAMPEP_0206519310 /NCGR_PEP_ID=MMETSP0324_2-20121206/65112_1 /ASSEMBLY_ACC=CAM_ASM_000836 /TAXON_ID=2866 /ORGANISM="Crypthecodinium cohnii, Strain Seligo" /LENGTH=167 /DNA_ID=CAMNT_0054012861 /DNA_START=74 /DNA_END=577 /DNA_ORIENTATION=+
MHFGARFAYDFGRCQGRCFANNHCTGTGDCTTHYDQYGYIMGCNLFSSKYPFPDFDTAARCNGEPTGTRHCTWSYEDAGVVDLTELEATVPGDDNCCEGACTNFWVNEWDKGELKAKTNRALDLFLNKYPTLPRDLPPPACDFNKETWYAVDTWPRKDPWAKGNTNR